VLRIKCKMVRGSAERDHSGLGTDDSHGGVCSQAAVHAGCSWRGDTHQNWTLDLQQGARGRGPALSGTVRWHALPWLGVRGCCCSRERARDDRSLGPPQHAAQGIHQPSTTKPRHRAACTTPLKPQGWRPETPDAKSSKDRQPIPTFSLLPQLTAVCMCSPRSMLLRSCSTLAREPGEVQWHP